jgi:hypothetical protein
MNCPNCGASEEHVVVNSVAFCRQCGPRVWGAGGQVSAAGSVAQKPQEVAVVGARPRQRS